MDVAPNAPGASANTTGGATFNGSPRQRLPVLLRSIGTDVTLLVKQEIDLAKQEVGEVASEKAMGGGLVLGAAILALFVIGFLGFAGAAALDLVLPTWAAYLIVAGVFLIAGAVAALVGRHALRAPASAEVTKQTVKEDVEWAKRRLKR